MTNSTEKITRITSKDLLIEIYGVEAVQSYEAVKVGAMRLGDQVAGLLIRAVGGRPGRRGDSFDGLTRLGQWEFCLSRDSKNGAGNRHDLERAPGRCVQILELPNRGWMSAEEFLVLHGKEPAVLIDVLDEIRGRFVLYEQMRLKI